MSWFAIAAGPGMSAIADLVNKGIDMIAIDETTKADALLMEHYYWQKDWRPALGAPRCSPECRQSVSSRQWDTTEDLHDSYLHKKEMESVEWCLDSIAYPYRQAISIEMLNREAGAHVWQSPAEYSYEASLKIIIPQMKKQNLL